MALLQCLGRTFCIGFGPILTDFKLADHRDDFNLYSCNFTQLIPHKILRRIAHLPRHWLLSFMLPRQPRQNTPQIFFIGYAADPAFYMHCAVIPRRHSPVIRQFGWIPVWRDIGLICMKNSINAARLFQQLSQRIRFCNMPSEHAALPIRMRILQWNMIDLKFAVITSRNQRG